MPFPLPSQQPQNQPLLMMGKGGHLECLPFSSPPLRWARREQLGLQKARAEEHVSTSVSSAFGWHRSGSAVQRMRMEKPAEEGCWEGDTLWKSRSQLTWIHVIDLLCQGRSMLAFISSKIYFLISWGNIFGLYWPYLYCSPCCMLACNMPGTLGFITACRSRLATFCSVSEGINIFSMLKVSYLSCLSQLFWVS